MSYTTDEKYILRCFELAKKAIGKTSPNPYVGAVLVKDDKIIGEGFHQKSGLAHAEVEAFSHSQTSNSGATLYCNLEPCCHTNKKTPPCTQRIIQEGVSRVVVSNLDPNPEVAGKGLEQLKQAGIEVVSGVLESQGAALNEVFFTHITKKRPFIHLKWAQTLDGKIATTSFQSKWITQEKARLHVHQERNLYDAILIGAHTANQDNPRLTIRLDQETCKKRIILSPSGKLDSSLSVFTDSFKAQTLVITAKNSHFSHDGETLKLELKDKFFDLNDLLKALYSKGIYSLYVEGGSTVINSFLSQYLYDRLSVYIAPKLLGKGLQSVHQMHFDSMEQSIVLKEGIWTQFGDDILFESGKNACLQD